ncbi:DHH family phosphoesterase [Caldimonas tepidiphila]|uniref:DHH family phosphoesterase n=1 Tax=Caldimonas tepidiphila TaxID=2315841 RepID=UPI000E5AEE0A|nr:phosphoesterase [Caldimonas tepidiphila]
MTSSTTPSASDWPLRPERDDPRPLVIHHGPRCSDGFAAALAAHEFFGERAEYQPFDHGREPPDVEGRAVYILDFAFGPETMRRLDAQAHKLVLLDHHRSAADRLHGFRCCGRGLLHFDLEKSGARLAWEYFHPQRPLPALVKYVEDRDLWRWAFPESAGFLAALDMEPLDFGRWAEILRFDAAQLEAFAARGRAMDEKFRRLARDIAEAAAPLVFNGQAGLMVNSPPAFHSEVGHLLAERCGSFGLMWCVDGAGQVKAGLRSIGAFDTIPLAESLGGGGHPNASGFRMPVQRLPQLLSGRFDASPESA